MASLCYDNAEYHCAYWWFNEVHNRNNNDGNKLKIDHSTFITKFSWSSYLVGEYPCLINMSYYMYIQYTQYL